MFFEFGASLSKGEYRVDSRLARQIWGLIRCQVVEGVIHSLGHGDGFLQAWTTPGT